MGKELKININEKEYILKGTIKKDNCVIIKSFEYHPFILGERYIFIDDLNNNYGGIRVNSKYDGELTFCNCK